MTLSYHYVTTDKVTVFGKSKGVSVVCVAPSDTVKGREGKETGSAVVVYTVEEGSHVPCEENSHLMPY